jgi:hypothetical protein
MSLVTAQKVIVPQKKIMSRIFLNSGTLIVISSFITVPDNRFLAQRAETHVKKGGMTVWKNKYLARNLPKYRRIIHAK